MPDIDVSFVTAVYNCLSYTKDFLKSLENTVDGISYEIILVDDFSSDGTAEFLKSLPSPPYRVILNDENRGYACCNNLGAKQARGNCLCLLNNDMVLRPGWLEPMLNLMKNEVDVGAVGNIQINPRTRLIDHAGIFFDLQGRPAHAWKNRKRPPSGRYGEWNAITAACLLIPTSIFKDIGGFDEDYRNSFEDIDLCLRLRMLGYRLLVSYESKVEHYVGTSPGRHLYDDANLQRFLSRWRHVTARWGLSEWPRQYFNRYARRWWRMNPKLLALAFWLIVKKSFQTQTN